jgi:hypothetical protein
MPLLRRPLCFPAVLLVFAAAAQAVKTVPTLNPTPDQIAQVTSEVTSSNSKTIDQGEDQIRLWIKQRHVPFNLKHDWLPALMDAGRYQDVADLALAGLLNRTDVTTVASLLELRSRAFLALDKGPQAMEAAKSYYNVCRLSDTQAAIGLVGLCLAKCHPDDDGIALRFRQEQAGASSPSGPSTQSSERPMLKSVAIDSSPYAQAIKRWSTRTKFSDRAGYANLLLAADNAPDAEKVFRQLAALAATQDEANLAAEGIARSLRAEDGNLARANAWLASLQQSAQPASQP